MYFGSSDRHPYNSVYDIFTQDPFIKAKFDNWESDPDIVLTLLSRGFRYPHLLSTDALTKIIYKHIVLMCENT